MPVHVTTDTTQSLSNKSFSDATRFNGDVTISGNLSCNGTQTFNNTIFSTTSAVSVVHVGSGPALWVGNNGTGDIASFYDIDANVEVLHVGGNNGTFPNVGVKTSTPNVDFTVNGAISAASIIYDVTGNSNQWNNTYTFVRSQSSNNDSVFTTVQTYSATNWNYQGTDIKALTGNWDSTYSTVQTYSATTWNPAGKYLPLSGGTINGSINVATGQILSGGIDISTFFGGGGGSQTLSFNESNADLTISSGNTISLSALSGSSGGSVVYTYLTNSIWTNPSPTVARPVTITLIGGGGGGGAGRNSVDTTTLKGGAGGGAGAGLVIFNTWTNLLSATESIVVGAGGLGAASQPVSGSGGVNGARGNDTTITMSGTALRAIGGAAGNGGSTGPAGGGGAVNFSTVCYNAALTNGGGGAGSTGAVAAVAGVTIQYFVPTGGGGGGGCTAANAPLSAASGGQFFAVGTLNQISGAAVGVGTGASGSNGASYIGVGAGGAGGQPSNIPGLSGGSGGNGGFPGGGGGGGGAYGTSSLASRSGAGGNGGDGIAQIIVY
jgi:hypothetical protein